MAALWSKLLRLPQGEHVTMAEARLIAAHLAERLGEGLASGAEVDWSTLGVDEGNIDVVVRSRGAVGGLLAFAWQARLSVVLLGDDTVSMGAMVFLFCNNRRVVAPGLGEYLYFYFSPISELTGRWTLKGWCRDEFDEWCDFERLD